MQMPWVPRFGSAVQIIPQPPQLLLSLLVFTQAPPQTVPAQEPFRQQELLVHTVPQAPQLLLSVFLFTQVGKAPTVHTSGAEFGQLQVWEQRAPDPCEVLM